MASIAQRNDIVLLVRSTLTDRRDVVTNASRGSTAITFAVLRHRKALQLMRIEPFPLDPLLGKIEHDSRVSIGSKAQKLKPELFRDAPEFVLDLETFRRINPFFDNSQFRPKFLARHRYWITRY